MREPTRALTLDSTQAATLVQTSESMGAWTLDLMRDRLPAQTQGPTGELLRARWTTAGATRTRPAPAQARVSSAPVDRGGPEMVIPARRTTSAASAFLKAGRVRRRHAIRMQRAQTLLARTPAPAAARTTWATVRPASPRIARSAMVDAISTRCARDRERASPAPAWRAGPVPATRALHTTSAPTGYRRVARVRLRRVIRTRPALTRRARTPAPALLTGWEQARRAVLPTAPRRTGAAIRMRRAPAPGPASPVRARPASPAAV